MMDDEMQYIVDEDDNIVGKAPISEAHASRKLHRGSHVFIFNSKGELLLHKRSKKWTFPDMWDSSAGGHVAYGSSYYETAVRELKEELGISAELNEIGKITHRRTGDKCNGIVMLYSGQHDGPFLPNKNELQEIKFFSIDKLLKLIKNNPDKFTPSFILAFKLYLSKMTYNVDEKDKPIKRVSVKEAHENRLLHRACYVILEDNKGRLMLQKRSNTVRNYPGQCTASATGHVDYGETYEEAAHREMEEEIGVNVKLKKIGKFKKVDNICNVWATLFLGKYNGSFKIDEKAVAEVRFFTCHEIRHTMKEHPEEFVPSTPMFLDIYEKWKKKN
ncbi:MAG TPA: NUDIX domain-containing protein [archaeon]|nr:NUDIX domain-containing protein [archaeon]